MEHVLAVSSTFTLEATSMSPIETRVIAITACILHIDPRTISRDDSFVMDLGAESIQLLQLAGCMEKDFDVVLHEDCMTWLTTVGEAADAISKARTPAAQH
jgi:acyl carrier protein